MIHYLIVYLAFQEQNVAIKNTFHELLTGLYEIRQNLTEKIGALYGKARKHPIHGELLKDPHTKRSYQNQGICRRCSINRLFLWRQVRKAYRRYGIDTI